MIASTNFILATNVEVRKSFQIRVFTLDQYGLGNVRTEMGTDSGGVGESTVMENITTQT